MNRIIGGLFIVLGTALSTMTIIFDFLRMAKYGATSERTALAFCYRVACHSGFEFPWLMAAGLWLLPVGFIIIGVAIVRREG